MLGEMETVVETKIFSALSILFENVTFIFTGHWKLLLVRSVCDGSSAGFIWMSLSFFPLTEIGFVLQTQAAFTMLVAFIILS